MQHLHEALAALPKSNLTVRVLGLTSRMVGEPWDNVTDLAQLIRQVTGETDEDYLQEIGERAMALYADPKERYQRAMRIYRLVDDVDKLVGGASLLDQVSQRVSFLGFMDRLIPKSEKLQAIDAGAKLAAELAAFAAINGLPGDSIADFARALSNSAHEDKLRISCWIIADGVLPFGPDFLQQIRSHIEGASSSDLQQSPLFRKLGEVLPGGSDSENKSIMMRTLSEVSGWVSRFANSHALTRANVAGKLGGLVDIGERGLDTLGAAIDMGTNYFEHTGTQTVARQVVKRAQGEV